MAAGFRIGIDLGGTKIEARRSRRIRVGPGPPAHRDARRRLPRHDRRGRRPRHRHRARARRSGYGRDRHAGDDRRRPPAWSRTPTRPGSTAARSAAISKPRSAGRCASPTTPIASPCPKRSTGPRPGCDTVFGVILGTGVGGGIVIGGRLLAGANAIAGEWGHNPLPCAARRTSCRDRPAIAGARAASRPSCPGPALAADHRRRTAAEPRRGRRSPRAAAAGDADCRATLERYIDRLARALASGHQPARSRRDRARRRSVRHRRAL